MNGGSSFPNQCRLLKVSHDQPPTGQIATVGVTRNPVSGGKACRRLSLSQRNRIPHKDIDSGRPLRHTPINPYISILRKLNVTYKLILFIVAFACCHSGILCQQPVSYHYQYFNTSHGLPSTEITCLAKDNKGFLWIGTAAGLSTYDGYHFTNYAYSKDNELIGYINAIKPGHDNRIWIGASAGLFCFTDGEIIKISAATNLPQGVNDILLATADSIWLATENGPARFTVREIDCTGKQKNNLGKFIVPQWKQENKSVKLISQAPDRSIYFSNDDGLFRLIDNMPEMLYKIQMPRDKITALFPVSKTNIYFDAVASELCKFENGVVTTPGFKNFFRPGENNHLPGNWYIGTRGGFYLHPQTGTVSRHINFSDRYFVWAKMMLEDEGFFWLASYNGLIKLKPAIFTSHPVDRTDGDIDYYSFTELRNGKILLGANHGKIFEKNGDRFTLYKDKIVASAEIKNLYEDEKGWLWAASGYQGLAVARNGRTERYTVDDGLHDNSVYWFLKTTNHKFYVGGDQGMSEIIVTADNSISVKKFNLLPNTTIHAKFFSGIEAPDGTVWLGGEEGLVYFKNDSLKRFLLNGKQLSINLLSTLR